jgi:hypothetical protein
MFEVVVKLCGCWGVVGVFPLGEAPFPLGRRAGFREEAGEFVTFGDWGE